MFDDLNQQNEPNQTGQRINNNPMPAAAEDMFAGIEPAVEKPAQFQPRTSGADEVMEDNVAHKDNMQKVFVLAMTVLGFVLLGVGAYFGYDYLMAKKAAVVVENEPIVEVQKPQDDAVANEVANTASSTMLEQGVDTDKDGLTDAEEQQLGTNIDSTDSDADGLFDREEVKVYKTNVLLADTDNDGMSDGDEVKVGRNPSGEGDLFGVNSTSTTPVSPETAVSNSPLTPAQPIPAAEEIPVATEVIKNEPIPVIDDKTAASVDATIDSDQDGLTDVDEAKYKTDPLNSDTDGDTYLDGAEVKGGYNPLGAGKLAL